MPFIHLNVSECMHGWHQHTEGREGGRADKDGDTGWRVPNGRFFPPLREKREGGRRGRALLGV